MRSTKLTVYGEDAADLERKALETARERFGSNVTLEIPRDYSIWASSDASKGKVYSYLTVNVTSDVPAGRYRCESCGTTPLETDRQSHTKFEHSRGRHEMCHHCCCQTACHPHSHVCCHGHDCPDVMDSPPGMAAKLRAAGVDARVFAEGGRAYVGIDPAALRYEGGTTITLKPKGN